jgi:tetratricopeptide (TPR) repeat protein
MIEDRNPYGEWRNLELQRAQLHRESGAPDAARLCCEEILKAYPRDGAAMGLMAAIAADENRLEEGHEWARAAIEADPGSGAAYFTLGRLFQAEGRLTEAEQSYRRSISLAPERASAHNNLGCVLQMQGKLDLALASYRWALQLDPALPQANQNLAAITRDQQAAQIAIAGHLRAAQDNPADAQALVDLGNTYRELGLHREAIDSFARALQRAPGLAEAHFARSFELLLCGQYLEGWEEYEWRWKVKAHNNPFPELGSPIWDGREIPGGTVLLHAEQGFGDTLQFVRYAPLVAQRCKAVLLECQPELTRLLAGTAGVSRLLPRGGPRPAFHAHLPLMSLPRIFRTTLDTIPWAGPYVEASAARSMQCRKLLAPEGLNVGLVWAGRPQQEDDRKRSVTLAMLAPLACAAGVCFYSLQKGEPAAQAKAAPAGMRLTDLDGHIADFADTAAFMSQLDLIITVDTSVAHLAGAMGRPTWVLVASVPDWRYHLEREDNPWYPTMRLFRQVTDGDWSWPIERAAQALARLARERGGPGPRSG